MFSGMIRSYWGLLVLCAAHVGAGGLIGRMFPAQPWVETLAKPIFYPPGWAFPVAWTILYVLMATALWLAIRAGVHNRILGLYAAQFVVNMAFSPLFFGLQSTLLGLIDVVLLLTLLVPVVVGFFRVSRPAGVLLLPYFGWVSFALALSAAIHGLNG